jgi:hypothetical protein
VSVNLSLANSGVTPGLGSTSYQVKAFSYAFAANETKWFQVSYSNPASTNVDFVSFTSNYNAATLPRTPAPTYAFSAWVYDDAGAVDSNYTVQPAAISAWTLTGKAKVGVTTQYYKVTNGATAQTIQIFLYGYNYH